MKKIQKKTFRVGHSSRLSITASRKIQPEYGQDYYRWIISQIRLLKQKEYEKLDVKHLIEEIESLGISDKRALRSHLIVLLHHLLKLSYCPHQKGNSKSWESSVDNARLQIELIIQDSPSLKKELSKMLEFSYEKALEKAIKETKIKTFPKKCPWKIEDLL